MSINDFIKHNREGTEGYLKSKVRKNNDNFGKKNWSKQVEHMRVQKGRDHVSRGVSFPCRHVTPNVPWKPLKIG